MSNVIGRTRPDLNTAPMKLSRNHQQMTKSCVQPLFRIKLGVFFCTCTWQSVCSATLNYLPHKNTEMLSESLGDTEHTTGVPMAEGQISTFMLQHSFLSNCSFQRHLQSLQSGNTIKGLGVDCCTIALWSWCDCCNKPSRNTIIRSAAATAMVEGTYFISTASVSARNGAVNS